MSLDRGDDRGFMERVEDAFHAALDLDGKPRRDFLHDLEDSDPAVGARVRMLVEHHEQEAPQVEALRQRMRDWVKAEVERDSDLVGRRVGAYRIERLLGRGGMGAVYLASRADGRFEQTVALKLLPMGLDSPGARRRFEAERQILAHLHHRGIAQLFDGGVTEDGTPYFAMEHVEGRPLDRYCDEERLGIAERVRLLVQVCLAVEHAHDRFVLHRDLKPSNILVTDDGEVKLLDFGVARVLAEAEVGSDPATVTRRDVVPMTPGFASPEQLRGGRAGVATDVYALGGILYVLLVGDRAWYEARVLGPDGTVTGVIHPERAFRKPTYDPDALAAARGTTAPALQRVLRGDLGWIVLRALESKASRRYSNVGALRSDLERHLDRRPVQAHPPSRAYVLGRWVGRHRAAAVAALGLVLGCVGLGVGLVRARSATARAVREAAVSEATTRFLEGLFQIAWADPEGARTTPASEVLQRGVGEAARTLSGVPDVHVRVLETLGLAFAGLGLWEKADTTLRRALAIADERLPPDDEARGRVRFRLAHVRLQAGDADAARELADEAVSALDPHPDGRWAAVPSARWRSAADAEWTMGEVQRIRGRYDSARVALERARDVARSATRGEYVPPRYLISLGYLRYSLADMPGSESSYREALRFAEDSLPGTGREYALALDGLASILLLDSAPERRDEGLALREKALHQLEALLGPTHSRMVGAYNNAGAAAQLVGRPEEATAWYRKALDLVDAVGGPPLERSRILGNLALVLRLQGHASRAADLLKQAVEILDPTPGEARTLVASHLTNLGLVLRESDRYEEAAASLARAASLLRAEFGADSPKLVPPLYQQALLKLNIGDPNGAASAARRLLALSQGDERSLDVFHEILGEAYLERGDLDSADYHLTRAEPPPGSGFARDEWLWSAAGLADARGLGARADSLRNEAVAMVDEGDTVTALGWYARSRRAAARDSSDAALSHLVKAVDAGLTTLRFTRDGELARLRGSPTFAQQEARVRARVWSDGGR